MHKTRYSDITPYVTKDGALIREIVHPQRDGRGQQSLAEATVPPGAHTRLHRHRRSEEIYYVLAGEGFMTLGTERFAIGGGDAIRIPPGTPHNLSNTGDVELRVLCCCAPAYTHEDTELIEVPDSEPAGG